MVHLGKTVVLRWCLPFYQTVSKSLFGKVRVILLLTRYRSSVDGWV